MSNAEDKSSIFDQKIEKMGHQVIYYNDKSYGKLSVLKRINFLKKIEFDIAHIQLTCGSRFLDGVACKLLGKPVIYHSHSNLPVKPLRYKILSPLFRLSADYLFACSSLAGQYFYGKNILKSQKFAVVYNGVDINKFKYSPSSRKSIRDFYGIDDDTIVVGFVGRVSVEKNIPYLIRIFEEIKAKNVNSKLIIVGDGEERNELMDVYRDNSSILFVGSQDNIPDYLSAIDILLLTSFFEALPVVLIEAQSCDLLSFSTSYVPKEIKFSEKLFFLDINKDPEANADLIMEKYKINDNKRSDQNHFVEQNGFSSNVCYKKVFHVYNSIKKGRIK